MHIIQIPELKITKYLPTDLSECDPIQYIEMSALIFYYQTGIIDYEEFRVHATYKLLGMKAVRKKIVDYDKYSRIHQLSELIDTFFEENENKEKVIKQYYIHNPIPKFRGAFRNFYGPSNDFDNIKFGEYVDALEAFVNFNQTGELIYLSTLLAIMYRKRDYYNSISQKDKRKKYNSDIVHKRAKFFQRQHIGVLYGFYLYFASFQKYLTSATIFIQGSEIDLSILFENKKTKDESKYPGLGMKGVLLSMAESGVYGPEQGVRDTPLWEILIRMYDITKRSLDEEAAYKKLEKK
ncbi:hypothetical protein ACSN7D_001238 [Flavobacterium psychrophilum]|uniref:Uncharacterized protein n=1 Tax=Flavobacterium phage 2A TaxID=1792273 RepID=A0A1B0WMF2_9CAUD|nr:hypothetical protein [Flavobacterium psychrophilum]YP_009322884.1 hypothetical protein BOX10_gp12 [Flavobacterium phage 2A]ANB40923.1 hypothetical protein [Flavobacterium phage 2A]EKT3974023.1 hypothetical protein [Flavobacterium psychrophilum]EKT4549115.1 hypothetical protein [Flavobacterium psychrophilum]OUD30258.1 hypothetical protein FPG1W08_08605 [Flavobacterium psychrophilum]OUD33061.1 hypothetical protein FPG10A_07415 [Flavobacterium psychrophilum]